MIVIPYKADHLERIDAEPNQAARAAPFIHPAIARSLEGPFAWTAADKGVVLGCAGFAQKWLDHWTGWAFLSKQSGPYMTSIVRAALRMRDRWPTGRVEAATPCDFPEGHKLLRALGFKLEAECMVHYTPDGRDHALYALVNGGPPA